MKICWSSFSSVNINTITKCLKIVNDMPTGKTKSGNIRLCVKFKIDSILSKFLKNFPYLKKNNTPKLANKLKINH